MTAIAVTADRAPTPRTSLPQWRSVVAVVAHPDDESFGLGAILAHYANRDAATAVLCFTHGEASTVHGAAGSLRTIRARELAAAADILGVRATKLRDYTDGGLSKVCRVQLAGEVIELARNTRADGLLVFDPDGVTGHPDHAAATAAALTAAAILELPVLGWTIPRHVAEELNATAGTRFTGTPAPGIDYVIRVDRTRQRAAISQHVSQAVPDSVLWRRLELLGDTEYLRLLHRQRSRN